MLNDPQPEGGPIGELLAHWRELPDDPKKLDEATRGSETMRELVVRLRKAIKPRPAKVKAPGISPGSQPIVLWNNRQLADQHRRYPEGGVENNRVSYERFCHIFPDAFFVADRGPYFDPKAAGQGRPLTAGFHLMQGYFRDDAPLSEMVLDDDARRELDTLWQELNFITRVPIRQYKDCIFFERAEPPWFMHEAEFDFARSEDKDATTDAKMKQLGVAYLAKARKNGANEEAVRAIETYFADISDFRICDP